MLQWAESPLLQLLFCDECFSLIPLHDPLKSFGFISVRSSHLFNIPAEVQTAHSCASVALTMTSSSPTSFFMSALCSFYFRSSVSLQRSGRTGAGPKHFQPLEGRQMRTAAPLSSVLCSKQCKQTNWVKLVILQIQQMNLTIHTYDLCNFG